MPLIVVKKQGRSWERVEVRRVQGGDSGDMGTISLRSAAFGESELRFPGAAPGDSSCFH
jgi:hypothetical protein